LIGAIVPNDAKVEVALDEKRWRWSRPPLMLKADAIRAA
jgi:hypothetical protein